MKYTIILIVSFFVLSCYCMEAHTLSGTVYDKITKQPIHDVLVYLDGTSFNDVTRESGRFELKVKEKINTKLVLHHVSYHTLIIENPFKYLPDTIYMEERSNMLSEVVVRPDKFTRRQKIKAFKEQFLGITQAGKSCKILNEDDIQIWYNESAKTLLASSEQPIVVINEYLGYKVLFTLFDFHAKFSRITLDRNKTLKSFYAVTTSFTDMKPNDEEIKKRRNDVYEVSTKFFFKSFAYDTLFATTDTLIDPNFRISKNGNLIDPLSCFTIIDTLSQKMIVIPDTLFEKNNPDKSLLRIGVSHRENPSEVYRLNYSSLHFFTDTLLVDPYGNIDKIDKVMISGLMAKDRAGGMLPYEYEPEVPDKYESEKNIKKRRNNKKH